MEINIETVNYIAKLAKLKFEEEEAKEFAQEFEEILSHLQNIDNEELDAVDMEALKNKKSVLRKDIQVTYGNKEELFRNAKDIKDGSIVIPKVIE